MPVLWQRLYRSANRGGHDGPGVAFNRAISLFDSRLQVTFADSQFSREHDVFVYSGIAHDTTVAFLRSEGRSGSDEARKASPRGLWDVLAALQLPSGTPSVTREVLHFHPRALRFRRIQEP